MEHRGRHLAPARVPRTTGLALIGAWLADLLLQFEGVTAFCLPLVIGALGWAWLRSQATGSAGAKLAGLALCMIFGPALAGLLPGHLHFLHGLPVDGVVGMLVAGALVAWLNVTGAWVVAVCAVHGGGVSADHLQPYHGAGLAGGAVRVCAGMARPLAELAL